MVVAPKPPRARGTGFSIVELMTTIAILALLLGFAIPSFQEFIVNYRTSTQTNNLLADLAFARTEAVKFARPVQVVADAGGWDVGWVVGADVNGDGAVAGADEVFRTQLAAPGGTTMNAVDAGGTAVTTVVFSPTGEKAAPAANVEFSVCRPDGNLAKSRAIRLTAVGRAQAQQGFSGFTVNCS